jgi:hypothetical protein
MYPGLSFFDVIPTVRVLYLCQSYFAEVTRGLNSLYVYCPLVESRMVGDAQVPLLRIVPVEGRDVSTEKIYQDEGPCGNIARLNPNMCCKRGLMVT